MVETISAIKVLETLAADMGLLSENIKVMGQLAGKIAAKAQKNFARETATRLDKLSLRNEKV